MTTYGYTRLSRDTDGYGLDAQARAIHVAYPGAPITEEVGSAGEGKARPRLGDLRAQLRRGDTLVVARLDRLARSTLDFADVVREAKEGRWSIVVLQPDIKLVHPYDPAQKLFANMLMSFAEFERDLTSQRISSAFETARAHGNPGHVGTEVTARIMELRASGLGGKSIAKVLNAEGWPTARGGRCWHGYTVAKVLLREEGAA